MEKVYLDDLFPTLFSGDVKMAEILGKPYIDEHICRHLRTEVAGARMLLSGEGDEA